MFHLARHEMKQGCLKCFGLTGLWKKSGMTSSLIWRLCVTVLKISRRIAGVGTAAARLLASSPSDKKVRRFAWHRREFMLCTAYRSHKHMHIRWSGDSKLLAGVNVSVGGCLSAPWWTCSPSASTLPSHCMTAGTGPNGFCWPRLLIKHSLSLSQCIYIFFHFCVKNKIQVRSPIQSTP